MLADIADETANNVKVRAEVHSYSYTGWEAWDHCDSATRLASQLDDMQPCHLPPRVSRLANIVANNTTTITNTTINQDSLPQFIEDFYVQKYGIVDIAKKKIGALICGVKAYCASDRRVQLFAELAGLHNSGLYSRYVSDCWFFIIRRCFARPGKKSKFDAAYMAAIKGAALGVAMLRATLRFWLGLLRSASGSVCDT